MYRKWLISLMYKKQLQINKGKNEYPKGKTGNGNRHFTKEDSQWLIHV